MVDINITTEKKMETQEKPKRQLTEAQRLAFIKAREKRLVNLEKKRQEKQEESMETENIEIPDEVQETEIGEENVDQPEDEKQTTDEVVTSTKKPRKKYTRKKKDVPEISEEKTKDIEAVEDQTTDVKTQEDDDNKEHAEIPKDMMVDHDLLADRIVERIVKLDPPVLKRESASRQPKQRLHSSTPPQINFNWM